MTAPVITSCRELTDQLISFHLIGKCIREIWNIGIIFDEDVYDEQLTGYEAQVDYYTKSIYENASVAVNQDEFNERHQTYMERHRKATERIAQLEDQRRNRQNKSLILDGFIRKIEVRPLMINEFDESLWFAVIDKVIIYAADDIQFTFRDGSVIAV